MAGRDARVHARRRLDPRLRAADKTRWRTGDPDNTPPNPLRDWAFAHFANPNGQCGPNPIPIGPDPGARTLVATKHEDCRGECTQILHYSNAQITVTDPWCFTTGIAGARENADVIEECALITAQYRPRNSDIIFADGFE